MTVMWERIATAGFFLLMLVCAGCAGEVDSSQVPWNQIGGDISNTRQRFVGSVDPTQGYAKIQVYPGVRAPVVGSDGRIFESTSAFPSTSYSYIAAVAPATSSIGMVTSTSAYSGQLSTPAVDDDGYAYMSIYSRDGSAEVVNTGYQSTAYGAAPWHRWTYQIPVTVAQISPPKILPLRGGSLIFVQYIGSQVPYAGEVIRPNITSTDPGQHLLILNDSGQELGDFDWCKTSQGGVGGTNYFADFGLPDTELQSVAIQANADGSYTIVAPAYLCGLGSLRITPGATNSDNATLSAQNLYEGDNKWFSTPTISLNGVVIDAEFGHSLNDGALVGYDLNSRKKLWEYKLGGQPVGDPALDPLRNYSAYQLFYDKSGAPFIIRVNIATGALMNSSSLIGNFVASSGIWMGYYVGYPIAAGSNVYVTTSTGLFTFDLDLNLQSVVPLKGLSGSPIIGKNGKIYVFDASGNLFAFPSL